MIGEEHQQSSGSAYVIQSSLHFFKAVVSLGPEKRHDEVVLVCIPNAR